MTVLILGATGLLGQAVVREARQRFPNVATAARSGADFAVDVCDLGGLADCLMAARPEVVVNCAGLTDLSRCEAEPGLAYAVNARPMAALGEWSTTSGGRLIHVSTDHYFDYGGACAHDENSAVRFVNEYARSKFAGEAFALAAPRALVLRTSIVGIRGWARPTLAEWAIKAVLTHAPLTLFTDAFTSSIDVGSFARAAFDLAAGGAMGLLNLAAADVYSKAQFVQEIARQLGVTIDHSTLSSVVALNPPRANSLGLDVRRAEALLGYRLPMLEQVVHAVVDEHRKKAGE